jgi:putative DNA primase/helicase
MDIVGGFSSECCAIEKGARARAKVLYQTYVSWAESNGEKPISQRAFSGRLSERGFQRERGTGGVHRWVGIGVSDNEN